jgi:23S rRNA pseudouridine1911/1915/1917 synthase
MTRALEVLYCDNHLLVVVKPAGIPCVPDASGDASLLDVAREWVRTKFEKPGAAHLGVVHRLDRPVSGLVVFARTSKAASRLAPQWSARTTRKVYWGVGAGAPTSTSGECDQWLLKDSAKNRVRAVTAQRSGAKRALTRWRILERARGRTLYEFQPSTGRPHQLRVCAASLGTPLLGDLKYGAREPLADASIALHARELEIEHPTRRERMTFVAPAPNERAWDFDACRRPI